MSLAQGRAGQIVEENLQTSAVRHDDELHLHRVVFVDAEMIVHVGDELAEPLRIAEVQLVEAGDVGVLLQRCQIELAGRGACPRCRERRARDGERAKKSGRLVVDLFLDIARLLVIC